MKNSQNSKFWTGVDVLFCVACLILIFGIPVILFSKGDRTKVQEKVVPVMAVQNISYYGKTEGNFSFIELEREGLPSKNAEVILKTLSAFEKNHPDLEIIGQPQIEYQFYAHLSETHVQGAYTHGVWIHHRPKATNSLPIIPVLPEKEK